MASENTPLDISVIIPFKNQAKMTLVCVRSLIAYGPPIKEVLLINNNSDPEELESIDEFIANHPMVTRKDYLHPFNYQKMNNWAVKQSSGKFIFFLNNDTELVEESTGVIETIYERARKPDAGMVGCLLLYGDQKTIQHAGVFLKPGLQGDHLYVGQLYKKVLAGNGSNKFPYDITEPRPLTNLTP